ncbi:hypothetical protein [Haloplanus sp. C73]|uniref:DUF5789 family protein n=1 Tax=Haloplanus sp. C73 TaxID=3421641 RepID=UPI003EBD3DFF
MSDDEFPDGHEPNQAEHVEAILEATECLADESQKFPVRREELATEYADQMMDLPNETESLGSVFDRLVDRRYESPAAAREAVLNELTGEEFDMGEYNDERAIEQLAEDTHAVGSLENDRE